MILAADIGGTKSLFALWETTGSSWRIIYLRQYPSRSFTSLKDVIENFLADYASTHGCAPVSYTHLDVYKRQGQPDVDGRLLTVLPDAQ